MENPVKDISGVIHALTQSPPSVQRETIKTYFTPNASFAHPFCRTGNWQNSRYLIQAIYRWYKIMSPEIELTVHSVAFDEANLLLYVTLSQVFRIWIVPFYRAPVKLVTVLSLSHNESDQKYYIDNQNDLYQVDQFVKFLAPGGWMLVWLWQFWATALCVLGVAALWPISFFEQWKASQSQIGDGGGSKSGNGYGTKNKGSVEELELRDLDRKTSG
ncbi:hypothetical protein K504DRAFT_403144 [Pleomassaria siparia CBS 279.74]|uniref:SigF-like NTF2-like domain-containing protein n=1 Tax=Pleomassaria siparia CBS 279.74 TaxID=1314801 RepID=A0A6G1KH24_9PLEO|nr:hypothetical protein K504DRAFT_403144 [Pleomassaria siparia CBS 279.74]